MTVEEITEAATARIWEQLASRDGGSVGGWVGATVAVAARPDLDRVTGALQSIAQTALRRVSKELRGDAALRQQPDWLRSARLLPWSRLRPHS